VSALRARGFEILTSTESGLLGAADVAQLEWCSQHGLVLVTHNVGDFFHLHSEFLSQGKTHGGIILMRQQTLGVGEKLRRLVRISDKRRPEEMKNRVEFLSAWD
jgi:hypothetical protein